MKTAGYTHPHVSLAHLLPLCAVLLASVPSVASAYQLRVNGEGKVLVWQEPEVTVVIDTSGAPDAANNLDAVRAGFVSWTAAGVPTRVVFRASDQPLKAANDGKNVVLWQTEDWGFGREVVATTVSTFERDSGFVADSDVIFNAVHHDWTNQPARGGSEYDVQNVMAHEAGHFFGMGHEGLDAEATMYPTTPPCELKKRDLGEDDVTGAIALAEEIQRRTGTGSAETGSGSSAGPGSEQSGIIPSRGDLVGCSLGASQGSWGAVALVLALLLLGSVRRRGIAASIAVLLVAVLAPSAGATVIEGLTLDQLTDRSEVVLRGRVLSSRARRIGGLVFTEHELSTAGCLKGQCGARLFVRTAGGDLGNGLAMHVDGVTELHVGQDVVLFLQRRGATGLRTVALAQGAFHLQNGQAVRDLRHLGLITNRGADRTVVHGQLLRLPAEQLERQVRARAKTLTPALTLTRPAAAQASVLGARSDLALKPAIDPWGTWLRTSQPAKVVEQRVILRRPLATQGKIGGSRGAESSVGEASGGIGVH